MHDVLTRRNIFKTNADLARLDDKKMDAIYIGFLIPPYWV
ncbi:MAG: hypothetical protein ACI9D5_002109, partial [Candidatus Endobugula sp.]